MIKLIPFKAAHMDLLSLKKEDENRYGRFNDEIKEGMEILGASFTAVADGRVLVVGGVIPLEEGNGYCWTMVSEYAAGHGISVLRVVKQQLEAIMDTLELRRVETSNIESATEHHKWCRLLGFEEEGHMRNYDARGRTYIRFAKIREG